MGVSYCIHQVSNKTGGLDVYRERVKGHLVPCVSQLAIAAAKESLWKPLNQHLLSKTRDSDAQVRLGGWGT